MNNVINQIAYLPTSRNFPQEMGQLSIELSKTYIDTANAVNNRTISIFPVTIPALNGESWFLTNQRQQGFREVYSFGTIAAGTELHIPTNIKNFYTFTRIYGVVLTAAGSFGNPDYRPLPYVDPGGATGGMTILVANNAGTQIIRVVMGAASAGCTNGIVVLEWISNV